MSTGISQRPATFTPVGNPVIYKFPVSGGPFTAYRIVIGIYRESDDSLIGEMSASPDFSGNVTANIQAYLRSILYHDWDDSETSCDEIGSINFYIKYQEFYTGSSSSPVDDSAEIRTAVLSSLQIGSNADLAIYVNGPQKFITKFDVLSMWRGYPFSVSFLLNSYIVYKLRTQRIKDGVTLSTTNSSVSSSDAPSLYRSFIDTISDEDTIKINLFTTNTSGSSTLSSTKTVDGSDNDSVNWYLPANTVPVLTFTSSMTIGVIGSGSDEIEVDLYYYYTDGTIGIVLQYILNTPGTQNHSGTIPTPLKDVWKIETFVNIIDGGISNFRSGTITVSGFANGDVDISETKTILVKEPCDNPVYLFWKNSLGGDSFWLFDGSQDYSFLVDDFKAKRLMLFEENINLNEWEAINEVNTVGQRYVPALIELTDDVNKTSARVDNQLYVIDEDGNKLGVVNINQENSTRTRQFKHFISVLIEYPEIFLT